MVIDIEIGKRCINAYFSLCCIVYVKYTFARIVCVYVCIIFQITQERFQLRPCSDQANASTTFNLHANISNWNTVHNTITLWPFAADADSRKSVQPTSVSLAPTSFRIVLLSLPFFHSLLLLLLCRFSFVAIEKSIPFFATINFFLHNSSKHTQRTRTTDIHSIQAFCHSFALYSFTCYENTRK